MSVTFGPFVSTLKPLIDGSDDEFSFSNLISSVKKSPSCWSSTKNKKDKSLLSTYHITVNLNNNILKLNKSIFQWIYCNQGLTQDCPVCL